MSQQRRSIIVISDLHLGAGFDGPGGNTLEDFTSDPEFANWIQTLVAESNGQRQEMHLIINGDFLEMLQVPALPDYSPWIIYPASVYEDNREDNAKQKLSHIMQGHEGVFIALKDFLHPDPPQRTLTVLKGNHDPEWYWPGMQELLRQRLNAIDQRADCLHFEPVAFQSEGLYVEHGNQYCERVDRFTDFAHPLDPNDPTCLELPPGSRFVAEYFNNIESHYFWVDGVHPVVNLIWYGLRYDFPFAMEALLKLLAVAPVILLPKKTPSDGVTAGPEAWVAGWQRLDKANLSAQGKQYQTDAAFRAAFNRRLWDTMVAAGLVAPSDRRAADFDDPIAVAKAIEESSDEGLLQRARELAQGGQVKVVVFGHTHKPLLRTLSDGTIYANSGTWIWRGDFSSADEATWHDLFQHPERYASQRHLTYVRIDETDGKLHAELRTVNGENTPPKPAPPEEPEERPGCLGFIGRVLGRK